MVLIEEFQEGSVYQVKHPRLPKIFKAIVLANGETKLMITGLLGSRIYASGYKELIYRDEDYNQFILFCEN